MDRRPLRQTKTPRNFLSLKEGARQAVSHATGVVKWFDPVKGFGFIDASMERDVFIHASVLQKCALDAVDTGDTLICDIVEGDGGKLQAIWIHSVEKLPSPQTAEANLVSAEVLFYNHAKGFGFLKGTGLDEDIYI